MNIECVREFINYIEHGEIKVDISKSEIIYDHDVNSILVQKLRIHFWNNHKTFTLFFDYNVNDYIQFERDYKLKNLGI